jgi:hypothetical protein
LLEVVKPIAGIVEELEEFAGAISNTAVLPTVPVI